ncbi:MAG: hypothetical protein ACR5KV_03595 [Wolbachia sp.]
MQYIYRFDSLEAINNLRIRKFNRVQPVNIGKDITIPKGILLGDIRQIFVRDKKGNELMYDDVMKIEDFNSGKVTKFCANNDCITIDNSDVVVNILSSYKDKILNQKAMCQKIEETLSLITEVKLDEELSAFMSDKECRNSLIKQKMESFKDCLISFQNNEI